MRVLYDGYIFSAQQNGGISRYFANLIHRLPDDWTRIVRLGDTPNRSLLPHPQLQVQNGAPFSRVRPHRLAEALTRSYLEMLDRRSVYDLCHPTYYFKIPERPIRPDRRPMVVTVFDMILERFASELDPTGVEIQAKRSMIESADAIICISQNTKRELQERYPISDEKITVTYLAGGIDRRMASDAARAMQRPYCVFLGNRGIYKNFVRTLLAFREIAEQWPELRLGVVGDKFRPSEVELLRALHLSKRVEALGFIGDEELATLYFHSEALIYPSLHEGFGIPPLEAMACETVVICSNTSSLPEVVGNAALMVNPESVEELAAALLSLRDLAERRTELIRRGLMQAAKFSWDETVRQTVAVYQSLVA